MHSYDIEFVISLDDLFVVLNGTPEDDQNMINECVPYWLYYLIKLEYTVKI